MRLFLDQMLGARVVDGLRAAGHDVVWAAEIGQAEADDHAILRIASSDNRILVTIDKHFGDWVVLPLGEHAGVVRVKIHPSISANVSSLLVPFLAAYSADQLRNQLVIVSRRGERWIKTSDDS